ncbi:MAG: Gx transporter family protein [Lachnospiraceae bacterium]|nr:Gx transporter family protein [Lachnospiraceae bacterium]
MNKSTEKARLIALLGIFTALAFILGFIESLIPPFTGIPGVKAGFANIVTMVVLYFPISFGTVSAETDQRHGTSGLTPSLSGYLCALGISVVRVLLGGITYNGMSAMIYGLTGAVFSLSVMFLLARIRCFSVTAVSVAGGVTHNIAQLLLAVLMLGNAVIYYLPMLIISGLAAGLVIGLIAAVVIKRLVLIL